MRNNNMKILAMVFLGFMFLSISLGNVVATIDEDSDGVDDEFEDELERDINTEIDNNTITIESILRSATGKNKIEFEISNESDGLSIKVEFTPNYNPNTNTSQIELEFGVTFREIVEYVDINTDGVFTESIDEKINATPLDDFKEPIYTIQDITVDTQLHYITYTTSDDVFTAHIYFVEEFEIINDTLITPSETKIDIEINNYNYLNDTSQLALFTKLESEVEYKMEEDTEDEESGYAENEISAYTTMNSFTGFFSWKENATVDGVIKDVLVSQIEDDEFEPNEQKMYLNYPRGTLIYHDPKIGIGLPSASQIPGYSVLIVVLVSVLGFAGIIYAMKKKQRI
ncbi:MAG: Loki-CTERM sorting domain-containing protein [Candidatus Thorarchaeota archaeon]